MRQHPQQARVIVDALFSAESVASEVEMLFVHLVSENNKNNESDTVQSYVCEMVWRRHN